MKMKSLWPEVWVCILTCIECIDGEPDMLRHDGGLILATPPSHSWLRCERHMRETMRFDIYGDTTKWIVRKGNALLRNFVARSS